MYTFMISYEILLLILITKAPGPGAYNPSINYSLKNS